MHHGVVAPGLELALTKGLECGGDVLLVGHDIVVGLRSHGLLLPRTTTL
jgi:hypothetical protein